MKYQFSRRTLDCRCRSFDRRRKGAILVTTVFAFLAFATLALSMVFISQVYLKVANLRNNSAKLEYASENGIKSGFHYLLEALRTFPNPMTITEERTSELTDSCLKGELRIVEENLGVRFPIVIKESGAGLDWSSWTDCQLEATVAGAGYIAAQFRLPIQSQGEMSYIPVKRNSSLDVRLAVAAGHIPLPLFSFLINKKLDAAERETFRENNGISLEPSSPNLLASQLTFAEDPLIPQDATPLLEKGLQIKIFRPQDLSNAKLRLALGLGNSDEPVPDGVYLIRNSLGLGGIYVHGDIQEMIMAIEASYQVISFQMSAGLWLLKFSPAEGKTLFISPQGVEAFDLIPLGIIMADGEISSLGGGTVDPSGKVVLVQDREIPSLLSGVGLTIVSSGEIKITSHLLEEGLLWRDGLPYLKKEQTQLLIYSTGQGFQQGDAREGGIVIEANSPQDLKVQASLTAQGTGFEILGNQKNVSLLGSLQAVDYISGGNKLRVFPSINPGDAASSLPAVPQTTQPVVMFPLLETLEWKEF